MQKRLKVQILLRTITLKLTLVKEFLVTVFVVLNGLTLRSFGDFRVLKFVQWRLQMRESFEEFRVFLEFLL